MFETLQILETLAFKNNEMLCSKNLDSQKLCKLVKLICDNTYFKHREVIYKQEKGFPMGSPLSGTLCNIYMNIFENKLLQNSKFDYEYYRYVDDILIIWFGTSRQFGKFFKDLNSMHQDIKFKMSEEEGGGIEFLDLYLRNDNNKLAISHFRKKYQSDHVLNYSSAHSTHIKTNIVENFIRRIDICSSSDILFNESMENMINLMEVNGYSRNFVNKIFKKYNSFQIQELIDKRSNSMVLEYRNNKSRDIKKLCKEFGIDVVFRYNNKIKNILCTKFNRSSNENIMGLVYKIECKFCSGFYLGETGRTIRERVFEHARNMTKKEVEKSEIAEHMLKFGHCPDENIKIIVRETDNCIRKIIESIFIRNTRSQNFNRCEGVNVMESLVLMAKQEVLKKIRATKYVKFENFS